MRGLGSKEPGPFAIERILRQTRGMASIVCPGCARAVPLDDVDLSTKLAKCRPCESVFDFRGQVRTPQEDARRRRELIAPRGYRIVTEALPSESVEGTAGYRDAAATRRGPLELRRYWRSLWTILHALGALALGGWSSVVVTSIARSEHDITPAGWLCASLLALPGLWAVGGVLVELVSFTRVRVDDETVLAETWPVSWRGRTRTAGRTIRTLHVRARRRLRAGRIVFDVVADTPASAGHVVVSGEPTEEGARFVARQIAERLGLPDPD